MSTGTRDWVSWLAQYEDDDSDRSARLVELSPDNVAAMRARAERAGLELEIVEGDAADTSLYDGAVRADLVLAVGIFGNIAEEDVDPERVHGDRISGDGISQA